MVNDSIYQQDQYHHVSHNHIVSNLLSNHNTQHYLNYQIDNYYNILEQTGYYNYSSVCKILVLSFIDDLLNTEFNSFISEDDYKLIADILNCFTSSDCLIPYSEFTEYNNTIKGSVDEEESSPVLSSYSNRITEDYNLRIAQDSSFRIIEV